MSDYVDDVDARLTAPHRTVKHVRVRLHNAPNCEQVIAARDERIAQLLTQLGGTWLDKEQAIEERDAAQAQAAVLRDALEKFGEHEDICAHWQFNRIECNCGLAAALAATEPSERKDA